MADPFEGPIWASNTITWAFATSDLPDMAGGPFDAFVTGAYQAVFEAAAAVWSAAANVHLVETTASAATDIVVGFRNLAGSTIGWTAWNTANGDFAPGVTVAVENPTLDALQPIAGGDYTFSGYDSRFLQTAIHEFGHALGLDHNPDDVNAVMNPILSSHNNTLDQNDIAAIQTLYGAPQALPVPPPVVVGNVPPVVQQPAAPQTPFLVWDTTAGAAIAVQGENYSGPVADVDFQYIVPASIVSDWINVTVDGNKGVFVHTGAGNDAIDVSRDNGRNVLDGGTGSNFLTGGQGADTEFLDARGAQADTWSTVSNLAAGDDATLWGVSAADFSGYGIAGAQGYTGLTINAVSNGHAAALTLSGYTQADIGSKLGISFGHDAASNSDFMHVVVS